MKEKRKYLYVLLLEGEHYYIGQTDDLVRRFRQQSDQTIKRLSKEKSLIKSNKN